MNRYAIYPSLMDAYVWMQSAEDDAEYAKRRGELLQKINRVPQEPSYAAARGTALNGLVDALVEGRMLDKWNYESKSFYKADVDGFEFRYSAGIVEELAKLVSGASVQPFCDAEIETEHGVVRLYGYADYVVCDEVIDLKTTSVYSVGKYRDHWQHYVYPYCLVKGGQMEHVDQFLYLVAEISAGRDAVINGTIYGEEYNPTFEECEAAIRGFLDGSLLPFLDDNRAFITDLKVFGQ